MLLGLKKALFRTYLFPLSLFVIQLEEQIVVPILSSTGRSQAFHFFATRASFATMHAVCCSPLNVPRIHQLTRQSVYEPLLLHRSVGSKVSRKQFHIGMKDAVLPGMPTVLPALQYWNATLVT